MKNEQREGLEELAKWRASLSGSGINNGDSESAHLPVAEARANVLPDSHPADQADDTEVQDETEGEREVVGEEPVDMAVGGGDDDDLEDDGEGDEEHAKRSPGRVLFDWIVVVGVALLVALVIRTFVLAHFVVDGTSMVSTLHDGDRVFVNKLSYRLHDPNRGDVVVLHQIEGAEQRDLIKRVIGLPGEEVEMRNCQVTIDGKALEEPYLDPQVVGPDNCGTNFSQVTIPDDHVWVMGDNRSGSQDSRDIGPIEEDELVGRAFVVFWPTGHWQWL